MLSDMQEDVRGVSEFESFCEKMEGKSERAVRKALKKRITEKLVSSGVLSYNNSQKTEYRIYGQDLTDLAIKYQETEDSDIFQLIDSYYMEYVYYNWLKCKNLFPDRSGFVALYREKMFVSLKSFDKNKTKKVRKNVYCTDTKKWKSVKKDEVRLDENGEPMRADFNDYFYSAIRYTVISEWNRQKSPKHSPFVLCMECGKKLARITNEHLQEHGLDIYAYKEMYPQAKLHNTPMSLDCEIEEGCTFKEIFTETDRNACVVDDNMAQEELELIVSVMDDELDAKIAVLRYLQFTDRQIVEHLNTTLKEVRKRKAKLNQNQELKDYILSFNSSGSKRQYYKKEKNIRLPKKFWRSISCLSPS